MHYERQVHPVLVLDQAGWKSRQDELFDAEVVNLDGKNDYPGLSYLRFFENKNIADKLYAIGVCPVNQTVQGLSAWVKLCVERGIEDAHTVANSILAYNRKYGEKVNAITDLKAWMNQSFVQEELASLEGTIRRGDQVVLVSNYPTSKWAIAEALADRLEDVLPKEVKAAKRPQATMATAHQLDLDEEPIAAMEFDGRTLMTVPQSSISSDARSQRSQAARLRDEYVLSLDELTYETDDYGAFMSLRNPSFDSILGVAL
jgi:hypothetical protein